jgi:regulation of enolase protein 1 (concanavalin A-like superfamily)
MDIERIKQLKEKFKIRDANAVADYNAYGNHSIESKLQFTSDRLFDLCGLVVALMECLEQTAQKDDE